MPETSGERERTGRANNIGALRLLFAALVVLGHAPDLSFGGTPSHEILMQVFGTLSFGGLAVQGFFLVSGYLVTKSLLTTRSLPDYLAKRVLRIFPGFAIASLVCILVVAPLAGGDLGAVSPRSVIASILLLLPPEVPGAFAGLPFPVLNGAMWTIPCEFGCYLLLAALWGLRVLRNRRRFLLLLASLGILLVMRWVLFPNPPFSLGVTAFAEAVRLPFVFLCGAGFYLFRDRITLSAHGAGIAGLILLPLMFSRTLAEPAFTVFGGYLIFWFAFSVKPMRLSLLTNRIDPSYGLYLYAFPVQNLLVMALPGTSPWLLALGTLVVAGSLGVLSWILVERPALGQTQRLALLLCRLGGRRPRPAVV